MQLMNGAQFLNVTFFNTCLFSPSLAPASAPAPVTLIVPLKTCMELCNHMNFTLAL